MTRSTLLGGIAGLLVIADGVSFALARTALLDVYQAVFVVAAFGALIVDRDEVRARMHVAMTEGRIAETVRARASACGGGLAPALLGLALAVKWSGLYYMVFFGLLTSLSISRPAARTAQRPPWLGTLRRDVPPGMWALTLIPVGVHSASYAPWFASETAIDRHQSEGPQHRRRPFPLPARSGTTRTTSSASTPA